ncbi:endonuclease I, partial [Kipferlia bialata]
YPMPFPYGEHNLGYNSELNCEHIVPQSFFDKKLSTVSTLCPSHSSTRRTPWNPMVSDVHHLRPAYDLANSGRSNYPFQVIPDEDVYKW